MNKLAYLSTIEIIIAKDILDLMNQGVHYKDIYREVKFKVQSFVGLLATKNFIKKI